MREALGGAVPWRMVRRRARADPAFGKGLYVVELPRRRLDGGRPRPAARPHLGLARAEGRYQRFQDCSRRPRLGAPVRPRAGDGDAGSLSLDGTTPTILILRSGVFAASRRMAAGESGTSWFETRKMRSSP